MDDQAGQPPTGEWMRGAVVVARDAFGHDAFWPADRRLPQGWRCIHGPCPTDEARAWIDDPAHAPSPARSGGLPPDADRESVPARLARLAAAAPGHPALVFEGETLTRGDLDARARAIAAGLAARGLGRESLVAVAMERGPWLVAALLGVLRAGAAFLPLDPAYPAARVGMMLEDAGIRHCLATPDVADRLALPAGVARLDPAALAETDPAACPTAMPAPEDPAYLIYTSGSTGRPKGVLVEHGPLAMHCRTTADAYEMDEASRELHVLSFAFDGAHERWMTPLMAGGCLVLRGPDLWTAAETLAQIRRHRVTHAGFPTSFIGQVAEWAERLGEAPPVQVYSFGGEAMPRETFARLGRALKPRLLINGYGPTECVVSPLIWKVPPDTGFAEPYAPIGGPVGARTAYILGPDLEPVAEGETGELFIGGGLARGYWRRPSLTAERFLPDPFTPGGGRMYRTGDRVRRRPDGSLAFAGRGDDQVKIRGHRIEIGEVEAALRALPAVADAVVLRREGPGGAFLAGYVVPARGRHPEAGRLRAALARTLPEPMVPANLTLLDRFPVTPNGKLDRAALPDPSADDRRGRPPGTATERRLAGIWSEVLGYPVATVDRPFFALGGDSLSALRLVARLRLIAPRGGIGVADLLRDPTIADLAARIDAGAVAGDEGLAPTIRLATGDPRSGKPLLVLFPVSSSAPGNTSRWSPPSAPARRPTASSAPRSSKPCAPSPRWQTSPPPMRGGCGTSCAGAMSAASFSAGPGGASSPTRPRVCSAQASPWISSGCSMPAAWSRISPPAPGIRCPPGNGRTTGRCWTHGSPARRCARPGKPCAPDWTRRPRDSSCASSPPSRNRCPPMAPRWEAGSASSGP